MARGASNSPAPLSTSQVPQVPGIENYVKDKLAAVKLGKALFWDMQAGSDGRTACASCHFNAGADNRSRNQLNPRGGGFTFKGANAKLDLADFPFHKLTDINNAASAVLSDTNNVSGSQGVIPSTFRDVIEGDPFDDQLFVATDPDFHVGSTNVRRSTGRNTPSAINAVFNDRNFWDGRAQNEFNGVDPFGNRDTGARIGRADASGNVSKVQISLTNSSLASQAVGPPGNDTEMSSAGRTLSDIGRKLLSVRPLASQHVNTTDSVLGSLAASSGRGLQGSYDDLIRAAFQPDLWNSGQKVSAPNGRDYSLMQFNFPLFWGLAIQEYESTLVSDQTPVDQFLRGDTGALSTAAQNGMGLFDGKGGCDDCHSGATLSSASVAAVAAQGTAAQAGGDTGFFNIGTRPTASDPGQGGTDPFGGSLARNAGGEGTFKTPNLRNVAMTAPYFHNGGQATLRQVVDFYSRGGDFDNPNKDGHVTNLALSDAEKDDLVSFLEALTDPRVRDQSAPFDHPQLFVPVGEQTDGAGNVRTESSRAVDCFKEVPATGAGGGSALTPWPNFEGTSCDTPPELERRGPGGGGQANTAAAPSSSGPGGPASKPNPLIAKTSRTARRCVVPRIKGRSLKVARKLLLRANCKLGAITPKRGDRYVVRTQRPAAGIRRVAGSKVSVTVRRPQAKRKK